MRDNNYLHERLDHIWDRYFSDIEQTNDVIIKFGKKARNRLGSIKQDRGAKENPTTITITAFFKDENIPDFIVDSVIAHEMVHYAHGFASPHEKRFDNPHAGGIIKKEMLERGLDDLFILQKKWLKENWENYLKENAPRPLKYQKRKTRRIRFFR